jgi:TolB-like protein
VKQVGRELGVSYVLEGSVRKAGERVRFTAQLVETETGARVWADRFDGVIANIFDLQDEITASVVGAIVVGSSSVDLEDSGFDRGWKRPTAA